MYPTIPKACCRTTCGKLKFKFATSCATDRRLVDLLWLVHTADAHETKLSCLVASAVWTSHYMVSVGISKLVLTDLIFVDPGVKINSGYYHDMLLSQQLLPVMRDWWGDFFTFQQDNSPAHRARTQQCAIFEQSTNATLSFLQICDRRIAQTLI